MASGPGARYDRNMPDAAATTPDPSVVFDDHAWPVLSVRLKRAMTDDEFDAYLAGLEHHMKRAQAQNTKIVVVIDSTIPIRTPRQQQMAQGKWMKDHRELVRETSVATAFVLTSAMSRFILSTILLVQPMATPYKVFGTVEEAEAWARSLLV